MSNNIRLEVTNEVDVPSVARNVRVFYTRYNYADKQINTYGKGDDPLSLDEAFIPDPPTSHYTWNLEKTFEELSINTPPFIPESQWEVIKYSPSSFVTPVNSIMPKILVPMQILTKNGFISNYSVDDTDEFDDPNKAICILPNVDDGDWENKPIFNWNIDTVLDEPVDSDNIKFFDVDHTHGFISFTGKDDSVAGKQTIIKLKDNVPGEDENESDVNPTGPWFPEKLVVNGAFCLVLHVNSTFPAKSTSEDQSKQWVVNLEFGEVSAELTQAGLSVTIGENTTTRSQLSQAAAKDVPPQASALPDAYFIVFYPVWNGLVVANGIQDSKNTVQVSQQFLIKSRNIGISDKNVMHHGRIDYLEDESYPDIEDLTNDWGPFNSQNRSDIYIAVNEKTKVDFGDELVMSTENCTYSVAYVPLFHSPGAFIDTFFESTKDDPETNKYYDQAAWPIWTDNSVPFRINDIVEGKNGNEYLIPIDDFSYWAWSREKFSVKDEIVKDIPIRRGGELFGFILGTAEISDVTTVVDNGSFSFDANNKAEKPQGNIDKNKHWSQFIKSANITIGLDGSSGQLVVDKYGLYGQEAKPIQSIGAIRLKMTNSPVDSFFEPPSGFDPVGDSGLIFTGLALGISDALSTSGSDCTIPLISFQKKMEDIVLINAPFMDGLYLVKNNNMISFEMDGVFQYLCKYCGVNYNVENAYEEALIPASDDVSAPIVDFKTGTTIQDAMSTIMELTAHEYFFDASGVCRIYELEQDGLPPEEALGPDWQPYYPNTKIMNIDRTPDFDDLRNELIVVGLEKIESNNRDNEQQNVEFSVFPQIGRYANQTEPKIPWSKSMIHNVTGYVTKNKLNDIAEKLKRHASTYELIGNTQIPGNASIKPYDRFGDFIVISVTHNIDFESKNWTTNIELGSGKNFIAE